MIIIINFHLEKLEICLMVTGCCNRAKKQTVCIVNLFKILYPVDLDQMTSDGAS